MSPFNAEGAGFESAVEQAREPAGEGESRRVFLKKAAVAGAGLAAAPVFGADQERGKREAPWYRRARRWGQTNITEADPPRYDIAWWRRYWKRTRVQGVIFNAGGIVAYYPSRFPLQYRPATLGNRDLFGELCRAAHEDGLAVLARMDSNRAAEVFYQAHPDWFAMDALGQPYRAGDKYVTCVNSAYYDDYIPGVLREIIERYRPEGITDNSWSGLGRGSICYCANCEKKFRAKTGEAIPREKNWDNPIYRSWVEWNYQRRIEIWELNNRVTKAAGGPDCLWMGMNSGSISGQSQSFRPFKEICARSEMVMLDHQARTDSIGFQENGHSGKLVHGILGWDKLIPESMAMYQAGRPTFRVASKPAAEARLWMLDGIAGGLQPWWHHVSAYHEDRRMYHTAVPVCEWHETNEKYLVNRQPVAPVGVLWSQANTDYFGRDHSDELVELPSRGVMQALIRARIPYLPMEMEQVDSAAGRGIQVLVLANLGAVSDRQLERLQQFVEAGGSLIASGDATRCNEWGEARRDFGLANVFGVHAPAGMKGVHHPAKLRTASETVHSYLRLRPELRAAVDGPKAPGEPKAEGTRHPILAGFDETDILPFGGVLESIGVDSGAEILATFIPSFPIYPPETAWMRMPSTDIPALVARETGKGGRVVYFNADIDRRYARDNLPDHGNLLANAVRWAARGSIPLRVEGAGLLDCHLYRQERRLILHLVNLSNSGAWRAPVDELIKAGPFRVWIGVDREMAAARAVTGLVSGRKMAHARREGGIEFEVPSILDHEVVVVSV